MLSFIIPCLKLKVKIRIIDYDKIEPVWFNKTIEKEISIKWNINKGMRKLINIEEKINLEIQLKEKREIRKLLVWKEVSNNQHRIAKEIIENPNKS